MGGCDKYIYIYTNVCIQPVTASVFVDTQVDNEQ